MNDFFRFLGGSVPFRYPRTMNPAETNILYVPGEKSLGRTRTGSGRGGWSTGLLQRGIQSVHMVGEPLKPLALVGELLLLCFWEELNNPFSVLPEPNAAFPEHTLQEAPPLVDSFLEDFQAMAAIDAVQFITRDTASKPGRPAEAVIPVSQPPVELRIALKGLVNVEEESKRIQKEIERVKVDLAFVRGKLTTESFMAKAPAALVASEKAKETGFVAKLQDLEAALKRLATLS